jgi:hypothetical protein
MRTPQPPDASTSQQPPAKQFLAQYEAIRGALVRCSGFALLPVEIPHIAVANAFAQWLQSDGLHVRLSTPSTPEDWTRLPKDLLMYCPTTPDVWVLAGDIGTGFDEALVALNAKRNAVAISLKRPLLWCGRRSFLCRTWEQAPQFWKLAEYVQPLTLEPPSPHGPKLGSNRANSDRLLKHLNDLLVSARRRGSIREAVDLGQSITRELVDRGRGREAYTLTVSLLRWLDDHSRVYAETRPHVAELRPTLERAARVIGASQPDISAETIAVDTRPPPAPPDAVKRDTASAGRLASRQPRALSQTTKDCRGCGGTGRCATCAGTGMWYEGTIDADECSSCGGGGRCPDCGGW